MYEGNLSFMEAKRLSMRTDDKSTLVRLNFGRLMRLAIEGGQAGGKILLQTSGPPSMEDYSDCGGGTIQYCRRKDPSYLVHNRSL